MLVIANTINYGLYETQLYFSCAEYYRRTSDPKMIITEELIFALDGHTYDEKKESARNIATTFSNWDYSKDFCGFSYGEHMTLANWLERVGRRYGLLGEFKENGLC